MRRPVRRETELRFREIPDEELVVGDTVNVLGTKRIVRIRPYNGRHVDIGCFALADTEPGGGFTLFHGHYTEALR